jgi:hypothetical protein
VPGGLSKWVTNIADVTNRSQVLNIISYIGILHNAYFLSNGLTQTLFSAISNSLAAIGIKATSQDPNGSPLNVGKIVTDWTETFFKQIASKKPLNTILRYISILRNGLMMLKPGIERYDRRLVLD